jgi:hypothetical protein
MSAEQEHNAWLVERLRRKQEDKHGDLLRTITGEQPEPELSPADAEWRQRVLAAIERGELKPRQWA